MSLIHATLTVSCMASQRRNPSAQENDLPPPEELDIVGQLHKEWRALIMVLSLVTALNNDDCSVLTPMCDAGHMETPNRALIAFTHLTVRYFEVTAAAIRVTQGATDIGICSMEDQDREEQARLEVEINALQVHGFATVENPATRKHPVHLAERIGLAPPGKSEWEDCKNKTLREILYSK
jgi:hypothetical protein